VPVPGLQGNFDNALAWGDYDNDNKIDFLISGTIEGDFVSEIWRNTGTSSNSAPIAPSNLTTTVGSSGVLLKWDAPADDHTPAAGLSYNIRVGSMPGGSDIVSAPALANGKLVVPQMGMARHGSARINQLAAGKTY